MRHLGKPYQNIYLTPQEFDTVAALIHGQTYKEAAKILQLSSRTVESYTKNIMHKLNCKSKNELIRKILCCELGKELYNMALIKI